MSPTFKTSFLFWISIPFLANFLENTIKLNNMASKLFQKAQATVNQASQAKSLYLIAKGLTSIESVTTGTLALLSIGVGLYSYGGFKKLKLWKQMDESRISLNEKLLVQKVENLLWISMFASLANIITFGLYVFKK